MTDRPLGDCNRCGAPAVRCLGTTPWCARCAAAFLRPIRLRVLDRDGLDFPFAGRAIQVGLMRPEFGFEAFDAECDRCGATWVALYAGESCKWCIGRHERLVAEQAELVLTPPDIDGDDRNYPNAMEAWSERLARAVQAGIVERGAAEAAWNREVSRGHRTA